jgi:hypothetical protein
VPAVLVRYLVDARAFPGSPSGAKIDTDIARSCLIEGGPLHGNGEEGEEDPRKRQDDGPARAIEGSGGSLAVPSDNRKAHENEGRHDSEDFHLNVSSSLERQKSTPIVPIVAFSDCCFFAGQRLGPASANQPLEHGPGYPDVLAVSRGLAPEGAAPL